MQYSAVQCSTVQWLLGSWGKCSAAGCAVSGGVHSSALGGGDYQLHTARSTLHAANRTLHTAYCILHTAQRTLHTPHRTLHTAHSTGHTTHCPVLPTHSHQVAYCKAPAPALPPGRKAVRARLPHGGQARTDSKTQVLSTDRKSTGSHLVYSPCAYGHLVHGHLVFQG